jgi:hypothetical protein
VDRCLAVYETSFNEMQPFEIIYRLKQRGNTYRKVFTKAKPNLNTAGNFTGFIGSCIELDPTEKEAMLA